MNNRVCGICIHGYKSGLESFPKSFQIFCCDVPYNNGEYEEARSISFAAFCEQRVSSCKFVSALDPDYPIVAYRRRFRCFGLFTYKIIPDQCYHVRTGAATTTRIRREGDEWIISSAQVTPLRLS
ncbi:hypothetical protein KP509_30G006300 [Ceratopteris richardii]|uniref:Uncharacterized protein n=1 Tax=Ceratopteris richardii TaxID=49495 RepID=A0A8T2R0R3_CERRI|nr:hypothetical protein KP509_30G006300 [Ceratopteris richardii]